MRHSDASDDLGTNGVAILSDSGRQRFAIQRVVLLVTCTAALGCLAATLALTLTSQDRALAWAKIQAEERLQVNAAARRILLWIGKKS